jgi:16S rRNA (guanine527-N7)-methyltransferase
MSAPDDRLVVLARVLGEIRARGGIGTTSIEDAIEHAGRYVSFVPAEASIGVDLGSGGGLPGLVVATARPDVRWWLVERRGKRADLLEYAVRTLGLRSIVTVVAADLDEWHELDGTVDVVTARRFAPLAVTATHARRLLRPGGSLVVSTASSSVEVPAELHLRDIVGDVAEFGISAAT